MMNVNVMDSLRKGFACIYPLLATSESSMTRASKYVLRHTPPSRLTLLKQQQPFKMESSYSG